MKKQLDYKNIIKETVILTWAVAIIAAAVYFFLVPSHTSVSSISGLGIVLSNFVPLPLSAITMILNVVLLIIGFFTCGREFGVKTVYTSIVLPLFIGLFERIFPDFESAWDHLKNVGDHGVENLDLDWVGIVPGYRESRRIEGDYLLNENDVLENRIFPDAVAYGGWQMDEHVRGGIRDLDKIPSRILNFNGCYTIPWRCYYAKDLENVMLAGRDISTSKMAYGSTRVMGTCSVGGQAVGTAAAMAVKYRCTPREIGEHIMELQQQLLRDDCYIPGFRNEDPLDYARSAKVSASACTGKNVPENVLNGVARPVQEESNCWEAPIGEEGASISLDFGKKLVLQQVQLTFDTNLTREIMPSMTRNVRNRQVKGLPEELVCDYDIRFYREGKEVICKEIRGNYQRLNRIVVDNVICDRLTVTVYKAYGIDRARIFEIRTY